MNNYLTLFLSGGLLGTFLGYCIGRLVSIHNEKECEYKFLYEQIKEFFEGYTKQWQQFSYDILDNLVKKNEEDKK